MIRGEKLFRRGCDIVGCRGTQEGAVVTDVNSQCSRKNKSRTASTTSSRVNEDSSVNMKQH